MSSSTSSSDARARRAVPDAAAGSVPAPAGAQADPRPSPGPAAPAAWRRFLRTMLGTALGLGFGLYLFIVTVDPWDCLPLSPPLPRVPISTNARFTHPALARSARFDAAVFGTSTSRLLRPAALDPLFGARFANLAMNSATSYEQMRLIEVFGHAHPAARAVLIGLDQPWCETGPFYTKLTPRPFPQWMYGGSPWRGYAEMFGLYPLQEAANQFAVMVGLKRRRYGLDGYTVFTPPESQYDAARAHAHILAEGTLPSLGDPATPLDRLDFPGLALLAQSLRALPAETRKVLFFVPYYASLQGAPGSRLAQEWAACKGQVALLAAAVPNTVVADFMIPSPITSAETNYWDPKHYRTPIADRLARDLAEAAQGRAVPDEMRILAPGMQAARQQ